MTRSFARVGAGAGLTLLGLLWMLQGADLVRIRPIVCVADCRPVTGGSPGWFLAGVVSLLGGVMVLTARRRPRDRRPGKADG